MESAHPSPRELDALARELSPLIHFGTSTWTYPGWTGLVYQREYPRSGASAAMLGEYARWPLFRTVGIDSFFYRPPSPATLSKYSDELPAGFPCCCKVWDRITAHTFNSPRDRARRGELNPDWLNVELFMTDVVEPLREHFGDHLGPLILEFQTIPARSGIGPVEFADALDRFFTALPNEFSYAVEIRNAEFLTPEYFAVLRQHQVAHLFNAWTRMPSIGEQLLLHDAITAPFVISRALLTPGRAYARAVEAFQPYDRIREASAPLRADLVALARAAMELRVPAYLLVNNRAEGCAPLTIAAVAATLAGSAGGSPDHSPGE